VTDRLVVDRLVERALGWLPAPDRYVKPGRGWTPRSKFRPLADVRDALRLVEAVTKNYSLVSAPDGTFTAQVRFAGRTGKATGLPKARAICLALAQALGFEVEENG
jgi:hypothetical protein